MKTARATVEKVVFAKPWHATDPATIACLNEITKALPEDGQVFLVSFTLNDAGKASILGRANTSEAALALGDRLEASKRFENIQDVVRSAAQASSGKGSTTSKPPTPTPTPSPTPAQPTGPQPPPNVPQNMPPEAMVAMQAARQAAMEQAAKSGGTLVMSEAPVAVAMVNGEPQANPAMIVGSPTAGNAPAPQPTPAPAAAPAPTPPPMPSPSMPAKSSRSESKGSSSSSAGRRNSVRHELRLQARCRQQRHHNHYPERPAQRCEVNAKTISSSAPSA